MARDRNPAEFTKEMRKTHTILVPMMLPIHFKIIEQVLIQYGYHVKVLETDGRRVVDEGVKNVHNDTCYPALLVIGQMIDALKSGEYDPDKTALMITQTGGGCRASNYIYLLRKALKQSGFENVPVISINFANLGNKSGFALTPSLLMRLLYAVLYGDLILWLSNQCKPYEKNKGDTNQMIDKWVKELCRQLSSLSFIRTGTNYRRIVEDFASIPRVKAHKPRVGVVGEIYMKYAPLGNNHLEDFLIAEGAEPVVSGVLGFLMYCLKNNVVDVDLYGQKRGRKALCNTALAIVQHWQNKMIKAVKKYSNFRAPTPFSELVTLVDGFIGMGTKMGEGWLLTAEMLELIHSGVNNIVSAQPFGCLPNHIIAKGMSRKVKDRYPQANIVAVDYDPSATPINQENRLKLMLANAKLAEEMENTPKMVAKPLVDMSEPNQEKQPVKQA